MPGQTYLVTFTTHQRAKMFAASGNAALLARSLHGLKIWENTQLLAWALMPDHLHLPIARSHAGTLQGSAEGESEYGTEAEEQ